MLEIWVYPRKGAATPAKIWPATTPPPHGLVSEAGEYVIEAHGDAVGDLDLSIDDMPLLALRSTSAAIARWLWSPGFYAGSVELQFSRKGRTVWTNQVTLDPDLAKLTRDEFDQMVREILADTFALFSVSSVRKGVARGPGGQIPPIARLEFLRSRLNEIERAVREIDASPVRILTSENKRVTSGRSVRITPADLARSFRTESLRELPRSTALPAKFGRLFPGALRLTKRRVNLDIGEHRAIKAELKTWSSWLNVVAHNLEVVPLTNEDERSTSLRKLWAIRCRALARRLQELLRLPVFDGVADANHPLTLTSIFRWSAPYRKFFRLSSDFRVGLAKINGDFLNMPIARTFELYELWAFLRLAKAGLQIFGVKGVDVSKLFASTSPDSIRIASSAVFIKLSSTVALCFKRAYEEYWLTKPAGQAGSFSRKMVPDISLAVSPREETKSAVIVLDAKYRVDQQLNDAVGTLHTYRDAIVQEIAGGGLPNRIVKGAYLVTPHLPEARIARAEQPWEKHILPGLLFHPLYKRTFRFGAVSLKPGMADGIVAEILKEVLDDAGLAYPGSKA